MLKNRKQFKKGAASMYVVVIAALLFGVITISFIRIIISDSLRTTNDELAQSAYDSALAGVEDAKTALIKYYSECQADHGSGSTESGATDCQRLVYYVENALNGTLSIPNDSENCLTIEQALQRNSDSTIDAGENHEVKIVQTTSGESNTDQAYTCVTINDKLADYRATLSSGTTVRVIPLKYVASEAANGVFGVKLGWYSKSDGEEYSYNDKFGTDPIAPPVLSVQLIQTAGTFSLGDFTSSESGKTDRGTIILQPTNNCSNTIVGADVFTKSNNHEKTNESQKIRCKSNISDGSYGDEEFACVAKIKFPLPKGVNEAKERNQDTFFLVVSLPYGSPKTSFSVQLCADDSCTNFASFDGVQTAVDSTGRANDMFSRVEARIELADVNFPFAEFALQLSGSGDSALNKNFYVTKNCWTASGDCNNSGSLGN
ncbi:hypothetical protein IJG10_00950 [Candidatus Saccharibacteria bacterium]|nr:hypothetical protein [Candidatus Saccharibacteria bacterium]